MVKKMLKRRYGMAVWAIGLMIVTCVAAGFAIAATDSEAPEATDTDTAPVVSLVGSTETGGAGGAGGAAGGAGGGATGGGGADVRVAQY